MSEISPVKSIRLVPDELAYVEAGRDFRDGMRSYDSAVTGRLQFLIGGSRLFVGDIAPATFDVSDTVAALYRLLEDLESSDAVRTMPFCCVCGTRACAYIRWHVERPATPGADDRVQLTVETLAGDPIGAHRYDVALSRLRTAVADLAAAVAETIEAADTSGTHAGTVDEFREWERRLRDPASDGDPSPGDF